MKTIKMVAAASMVFGLTFALGACAVEPTSSGSGTPSPSGSSGGEGSNEGSGGSGGASGSEYAVSCEGEVSLKQLGVELDVAPRCVGSDGGRLGCDDPCAAMDVEVRYEPPAALCVSSDVFSWDGKACKAHPTQSADGSLLCKGEDCTKLFKSEADCKAAFQACAAN